MNMTGLRRYASPDTRSAPRRHHGAPRVCRLRLLPRAATAPQPRGPEPPPLLPCKPARAPPDAQPPAPALHSPAPSRPWSRRSALLGLPLCSSGGLLLQLLLWPGDGRAEPLPAPAPLPPVAPEPLRSTAWSIPSELTVLNQLEGPLKVYWLNYDGDPELFGSLSPGSVFTVRGFESHAWRFVDATSGATVAEHVMAAGQQVVRVARSTAASVAAAAGGAPAGPQAASFTYTTAPTSRDAGGGAPAEPPPPSQPGGAPARRAAIASVFEGFDGLGNDERQYSLAQLREIQIYPGGGNVRLSLPGGGSSSGSPLGRGSGPPLALDLEVALAGPETLSLVAATGTLEQRRPSTLGTWTRSLLASGAEVLRVCITRVVDGVFYSRIVLSRPDSSLASLDATPGDSLSLALSLGRPIYVANEVVRVHRSVQEVFARRRRTLEAAAASGLVDEAAEAAADREAQEALDGITRGLPSAPRPVRSPEVEQPLDA